MKLAKIKIAAAGTAVIAFVIAAAAYIYASTNSVTIIVSRDNGFVELFVGLPAHTVEDIFDMPLSGLFEDDEAIDYADFQQGTWDLGDRLLSSVQTRIDGTPVAFEAMSLMVHPKSENVPFNDTFDAVLAVSVCNTASRDPVSSLSGLDVYAAFFALNEQPDAAINLKFPETGSLPVLVRIREFSNGRFTGESWDLLTDSDKRLFL